MVPWYILMMRHQGQIGAGKGRGEKSCAIPHGLLKNKSKQKNQRYITNIETKN
jgi:hypothetical protein